MKAGTGARKSDDRVGHGASSARTASCTPSSIDRLEYIADLIGELSEQAHHAEASSLAVLLEVAHREAKREIMRRS
jgi:hypothetical protein